MTFPVQLFFTYHNVLDVHPPVAFIFNKFNMDGIAFPGEQNSMPMDKKQETSPSYGAHREDVRDKDGGSVSNPYLGDKGLSVLKTTQTELMEKRPLWGSARGGGVALTGLSWPTSQSL